MKSLLMIFIACGALHGMETELIDIKVIPNDAIGNQNLAWEYPQSLQGFDKITQWEDRLKTAETTNNTTLMLKVMHNINMQSINKQNEELKEQKEYLKMANRGILTSGLVAFSTFLVLTLHTLVS